MVIRFTRKHIVLLCALVLVVFSMMIAVYFLFINSINKEIELTKKTIQTEETILQSVTEQLSGTKYKIENSHKLQKKLPVQPSLDQFLMDLEKAEDVSNSMITEMNFDKGELEGLAKTSNKTPIPKDLQRIIAELKVYSPSYDDFALFLNTLEQLERVTKIDEVHFSGPSDLDEENEMTNSLYSVTLSIYYLPSLSNLEDEMPKLDTPTPSQKDNPLYEENHN